MLRERGAEVKFIDFPVLRRANQSTRAFLAMLWSAAVAVPRLVWHIRRISPSVTYVNTVTLPWWLLASWLARIPTVCHLHEAENTDGAMTRRALIAPLRLADAVIVISKSAMTAMVNADRGLQAKGHLIYNGVPQPPAAPTLRPRSERIRLVVVGRLSPRKAPHLALEAVAKLRSRGYRVEIVLAGSAFPGYEWYVDQLQQRASQPDLANAVEFVGYCSPIWPILNDADIVVAPSLREPFGNAVVEAQLSLRPVVATAAMGHLESISDSETGLLVPPEDVDEMAHAIARLVDNPELAATLAVRARKQAIDRCSVVRYDAEIAGLLGGLARRPKELTA
jgi:glycosyltransferase involved in cell wall biosynthesis